MWPKVQRWRGVVLCAVVIVATMWLAITNQLILYIHPRYVLFTVVMALFALVFIIASTVTQGLRSQEQRQTRWQALLSASAVVLAVVIAGAMIVVPPATLTSATVSQRDINGAGIDTGGQTLADASAAPSSAFANFTVRDWASLLRQTSDLAFYGGKPVDVVGFVTADPDDPANVFYVSRFMITCCAVDAQPVGVPVYLPGWEEKYPLDAWVQVKGELSSNPSSESQQGIALVPDEVSLVDQPAEPYLF